MVLHPGSSCLCIPFAWVSAAAVFQEEHLWSYSGGGSLAAISFSALSKLRLLAKLVESFGGRASSYLGLVTRSLAKASSINEYLLPFCFDKPTIFSCAFSCQKGHGLLDDGRGPCPLTRSGGHPFPRFADSAVCKYGKKLRNWQLSNQFTSVGWAI